MLSPEQQKLVEDNMNLVFLIVHKYKFNIEDADLGFIALCKAARKFDPTKGYKFTSFASRAIINAFFYEYRKGKAQKKQGFLISTDEVVYTEGSEDIHLEELLPSDVDVESNVVIEEFFYNYNKFIESLKPEYQEILRLWLNNTKQHEIAEQIGKSQAQVSRVVKRLNQKFREQYYPDISYLDLEEDLLKWQKR